ncbi:uncharacterized protein LOC134945828 isoform X2 [Pseudophryne corroboree]|uniref:uncharacterized protein LOC134945828 isoform X2 n=1 Tax=Pseudophryne corroboree TaxID=495146 RepID=UPI0030820FFC
MTPGETDVSHTASGTWILGGLGISVMAFLLGCASCRQNRSSDSAERRPPPPSPAPEIHLRYEPDLYPPTPGPVVFPKETRATDSDEEDYVEISLRRPIKDEDLNAQRQSNMSGQNSAASQKSLGDASSQGTYVNIGEQQDYVNVTSSNLDAPVLRKDHTYLEVFPSNDETDTPAMDTAAAEPEVDYVNLTSV